MSAKRLTAAEVVERLAQVEMKCLAQCIQAGDFGDMAASHMREAEAAIASIFQRIVEDNLIETPEQSRERFELFAQQHGYSPKWLSQRTDDGRYESESINEVWRFWEASRTFRSEQES